MNSNIYFSIIICCFNSEKYIRETINSVVNQSYQNWEIIIINDGSSDKTEKIILEFIDRGIQINYFRFNTNVGFAAGRNKAIELSKYDWIAIIDHDDICQKDRLKIHVDQINNNPDCMLFFGNSIIFSNENSYISDHLSKFNLNKLKLNNKEVCNSLLLLGCFIDSETVIFNKKASAKIGNFNIKYKTIADYDFFIRMGKYYNFNYTKIILSKWRLHENQITNRKNKKMKRIFTKEYILMLFDNISFQNNILLNILIILKIIKQLIKYIII